MYRFVEKSRFIVALLTVLVIAAAPFLQAGLSVQVSNACSATCCCNSSGGESETPAEGLELTRGSCGCSMSLPATQREIPFEANLNISGDSESYVGEPTEVIEFVIAETEFKETVQISELTAHGPPLFVLHASYLI